MVCLWWITSTGHGTHRIIERIWAKLWSAFHGPAVCRAIQKKIDKQKQNAPSNKFMIHLDFFLLFAASKILTLASSPYCL